MEYIRIANEGDLLTVYKEIRINIIRVLNKYCTKDYIEDGSECLDLFALYDVPSVNVDQIINCALQLEGLAESIQDVDEICHLQKAKEIAKMLETEMAKLR